MTSKWVLLLFHENKINGSNIFIFDTYVDAHNFAIVNGVREDFDVYEAEHIEGPVAT